MQMANTSFQKYASKSIRQTYRETSCDYSYCVVLRVHINRIRYYHWLRNAWGYNKDTLCVNSSEDSDYSCIYSKIRTL